jgi:hypothetical protein
MPRACGTVPPCKAARRRHTFAVAVTWILGLSYRSKSDLDGLLRELRIGSREQRVIGAICLFHVHPQNHTRKNARIVKDRMMLMPVL